MRKGAIILCGGRSSRMGRDKATLPFGPEQMIQRVVRLIGEAVERQRVVVVAAAGQLLPELPADVLIARDVRPHQGPLAGLAIGLQSLEDRCDAAFATACDVPLLVPAFVSRMFELLDEYEIAVPFDGKFHHPLAAVYRPMLLPRIEKLLAAGRMRPRFLFDDARTREIAVDELREVDPELLTLENLNDSPAYRSALARTGFRAPSWLRDGG
jgi:molybdenum cofactor guanylyltransferase